MGTRQVEVTIPFQVKKDKREAPGKITLPPEGVPNKPLGFIILHGAARGKHDAHATETMTAYVTTLAEAGFTVVRYTHRSNVEGRGRMVGVRPPRPLPPILHLPDEEGKADRRAALLRRRLVLIIFLYIT